MKAVTWIRTTVEKMKPIFFLQLHVPYSQQKSTWTTIRPASKPFCIQQERNGQCLPPPAPPYVDLASRLLHSLVFSARYGVQIGPLKTLKNIIRIITDSQHKQMSFTTVEPSRLTRVLAVYFRSSRACQSQNFKMCVMITFTTFGWMLQQNCICSINIRRFTSKHD